MSLKLFLLKAEFDNNLNENKKFDLFFAQTGLKNGFQPQFNNSWSCIN